MRHWEKKQVSNLELIDCTRVSEILRIRGWVQKCGRCREWEANKTGPQTTNWLGGLESEGWKWKIERWHTERFRQKVECCSLPKHLLGVGVAACFSSSPLFTFSLRACGREVAAISVPAQRGEKPSVPWVSEGERMEENTGATAAPAFKLAKCLTTVLHNVCSTLRYERAPGYSHWPPSDALMHIECVYVCVQAGTFRVTVELSVSTCMANVSRYIWWIKDDIRSGCSSLPI